MTIETRRAIDPRHARTFDTAQLRAEFLIEQRREVREAGVQHVLFLGEGVAVFVPSGPGQEQIGIL